MTLIARGAHLEAMRRDGITVRSPEGDFVAHPRCTDDLAAAGEADVAFLTVKAHALTDLAPRLAPSWDPRRPWSPPRTDPLVVLRRAGQPLAGTRLETVDPGGVIGASIESRRVLGCVVYPATRIVAPGVIEHVEGNRFSVAELDDSRSERREALAAALSRAGRAVPHAPASVTSSG